MCHFNFIFDMTVVLKFDTEELPMYHCKFVFYMTVVWNLRPEYLKMCHFNFVVYITVVKFKIRVVAYLSLFIIIHDIGEKFGTSVM